MSYRKLAIRSVILALIMGGLAPYFAFRETGGSSVAPDFQISLRLGQDANDPSALRNITSTETILNGTSGLDNIGLKIIVLVASSGSFSDSIFLGVLGLPFGITHVFQPSIVTPVADGTTASALTLTATSGMPSQQDPYNITIVATSISPTITHSASFPLRVRSTNLFWNPSIIDVTKGQKFTLSLALSDVSNVTGFQITAHFNSTLFTALANGTRFNTDFQNFGFIIPQRPSCPWVDNSTGTIGPCGLAATLIGQCSSVPCINVVGPETYTLLNQTFVANTNYNGTALIVLNKDDVIEVEGQTVLLDPHHTLAAIVSIGPPDSPPTPAFLFEPQPVQTNHSVMFNGSPSMDPDGFITSYTWNFGDGSLASGKFASHSYDSPGNYTLTLTVTDNVGLTGTLQSIIEVLPLSHDVGIVSVNPEPKTAVSGQKIDIGVDLTNFGQQSETVNLTVYYDSHIAVAVHDIVVPVTGGGSTAIPPQQFTFFVPVSWDTSEVPAGSYEMSATVFLANDQNLANNHLADGLVTILPQPVLTLTPSRGSPGDKIQVQGSGFPAASFPSFESVKVTFDDVFLGFATLENGSFNFTFDIPHADPGVHLVKAEELSPSETATTSIRVLVSPSDKLEVSIETGPVYFPDDTATIYVLTSRRGVPADTSDIQLQLVVTRPDGSNISLVPTQIGPGLLRAFFKISNTASLGTYSISAKAHLPGPLDANAIRTFEVRPPWLSAQGTNIATALTFVGFGAVGALGWRKGFFKRRNLQKIDRFGFAFFLLTILLVGGLAVLGPKSVRAANVFAVNLDANSTSQTDVLISASTSQAKSFRIGAVVNATNANPISGVFGWQFTINYNATDFVPEGDPSAASLYPDGATNTVLFGAQTIPGAANWAGLIAASNAFGGSTASASGSSGQITVFLTLLGPAPAQTLSTSTLLASVQFELLSKPSTPQQFTITNVEFTDSSAQIIPNISPGSAALEAITNSPPIALFTSVPAPQVSPYAVKFNATSSNDSDGTIANATGYFWDFGDGTQDLGQTGQVVTHDYGMQGTFNVTLRVQDNQGATGAARDQLGGVVVNSQPSHQFRAIKVRAAIGTSFSLTASPEFLSIGPDSVGEIGNSTITIANTGTNSPITVSLAATSTPGGLNAPTFSFTPSTLQVPAGGQSTALVSVSITKSTPHTDYNVTLTGTSGTTASNATITIIPTTISVQPPVSSAPPGKSFTVNVDGSAANLIAWQFTLHYDPAVLSTTFRSVTFGPFWQNALSNNQGFPVILLNQTSGSLTIAFTLLSGGSAPPISFNGNSTLASIRFTPSSYNPSSLHLSNIIFLNALQSAMPVQATDGMFSNGDAPPVARFTISPTSPTLFTGVTFDGSGSTDSDGSIVHWAWSFGDGYTSTGPSVLHFYQSAGSYNVMLTVTDNGGLTSSKSMVIVVIPGLLHDVAVTSVSVFPTIATSGQELPIRVLVENRGIFNETVDLTVSYDSHVITIVKGISLLGSQCFPCDSNIISVIWDTTGVPAGSYAITATVSLATDQDLSNNSFTTPKLTILAPPSLTISPSSGGVGTQVIVNGSGFYSNPFIFPGSDLIVLSFDDMFLGTTTAVNGSFTFTLDVPFAGPGMHLIKAIDQFTSRAKADFQILPSPDNNLSLSLDVGGLYFPGDTATVYASTSLNGLRMTLPGEQLQILVYRPDGSNMSLSLTTISPGYYKASFIVPKGGLLGTYAIVATLNAPGPLDASSLSGFEVKLSWLGAHSSTIMTAIELTTAIGLAGVIGVLGLSRWGYFGRRNPLTEHTTSDDNDADRS